MRLSLTGPLRPNSLSVRLIAISALWTAVAVAAAGIILTSLYRGTVERNFDERLDQYYLTLVGALSTQNLQRIAFGQPSQAERREPLLRQLSLRIRDVQQGPDGYIYVATERRFGGNDPDGTVLKLEPLEGF